MALLRDSRAFLLFCLLIILVFLLYTAEIPQMLHSVDYWKLIGGRSIGSSTATATTAVKNNKNLAKSDEMKEEASSSSEAKTIGTFHANAEIAIANTTSTSSTSTVLVSSTTVSSSMENLTTVEDFNDTSTKRIPIILGWNRFWYKPVYEFRYLKWGSNSCPYECSYTEDKKLEHTASVLMFHAGEGLGQMPQHRRPDQLYTMVSHESPHLSCGNMAHLPSTYFNVSITYRTDSTIYIPYEELIERTPETPAEEIWREDEINDRIKRKTKLALQMVSNCNAPSGRDALTEQLKKLMELDVFGRCNGKQCDKEQCQEHEWESHFFYLAFENSVCPQYVTEKFWNALRRLVVPVVLNRAILKESGIPDDVFIAVDDFDSAQALVDHLKALRDDIPRYRSYFNWTQKYQKSWDHDRKPSALCQLCQLAHRQSTNGSSLQIVDFEKFWTEKECQRNFVKNTLFKQKH